MQQPMIFSGLSAEVLAQMIEWFKACEKEGRPAAVDHLNTAMDVHGASIMMTVTIIYHIREDHSDPSD